MNTALLKNTIMLANSATFIRQTIEKVGLEYIAPLDPAVQAEKISKALTAATKTKDQE